MSAEQIAEIDYNVYVNHKNEDILFNATNRNTEIINIIVDYVSNINFYWIVFQVMITVCLYLLVRWIENLQKRIETLEEDRPEKQPLLATF